MAIVFVSGPIIVVSNRLLSSIKNTETSKKPQKGYVFFNLWSMIVLFFDIYLGHSRNIIYYVVSPCSLC